MTSSDEDVELSELLEERFAGLSSPGRWALASVAVVKDRTGFWLSGVTPTSAFHIGSVTKTLTALTLALLSVEGRVGLEDRLDEYLNAAAGSGVRLIDLATHTAGYPQMPRALWLRALRRPADPYSCISNRDVDRALRKLTRRDPSPRHPFAYSNFGYGVLSRALEVAGGDSFFDILRAEALVPLGLTATTLDLAEAGDRVAGHDASGRMVPAWHLPTLPGCGCLWSTIENVHTYLYANLHPQATSISDALRLVHEPREAAGEGRRIGLAWLISETEHGDIHWHNGGTSGFGAFLGLNPERQVGVGVLCGRAHTEELDRSAMGVLARLALLQQEGRRR